MAQRRHHYEQAFAEYLRARRIPYVAVDEARKALLPAPGIAPASLDDTLALKSFDFVLYTDTGNLLVDVKGRKAAAASRTRDPLRASALRHPPRAASLQNWVTQDDIDSLTTWQRLFGHGFAAAFAFIYWCDDQPPDGLFHDIIDFRARWYAVRLITLADYTRHLRPRSPRWRTVHLPAADFNRLSTPLTR